MDTMIFFDYKFSEEMFKFKSLKFSYEESNSMRILFSSIS